jgi:hypothetical protein
MAEGQPFEPSFAHAVKAHRLVRALEQSSAAGTAVSLAVAGQLHSSSRLL